MAVAVSACVFVMALSLLLGGPYPIGFAVIAVFISAITWWLASVFGLIGSAGNFQQTANDLNAIAASVAALAGVLTIDHGWDKIMAIGNPVAPVCECKVSPTSGI